MNKRRRQGRGALSRAVLDRYEVVDKKAEFHALNAILEVEREKIREEEGDDPELFDDWD